MAKDNPAALRIVIANRLRDGRVVYLGAEGWTHRLDEAEIAASKEAADALQARAQASFARNEVVDVYLTEAEQDEAGVRLRNLRERIRTRGPTVRTDLGYQAGEVK